MSDSVRISEGALEPTASAVAPVPAPGAVQALRARVLGLALNQASGLAQPHRWPWALALSSLGAAALLGLGLAPAWRAEAAAKRERDIARPLPSEYRVGHRAGQGAATPPVPPRAAMTLPPASESSARAARLLHLARAQGVVVTRLRETAAQRGVLQLELSARAPYPALRRFVALALQQDGALELRHLRAHRASTDAVDLDIDLQWALWHRAGVVLAARGGSS